MTPEQIALAEQRRRDYYERPHGLFMGMPVPEATPIRTREPAHVRVTGVVLHIKPSLDFVMLLVDNNRLRAAVDPTNAVTQSLLRKSKEKGLPITLRRCPSMLYAAFARDNPQLIDSTAQDLTGIVVAFNYLHGAPAPHVWLTLADPKSGKLQDLEVRMADDQFDSLRSRFMQGERCTFRKVNDAWSFVAFDEPGFCYPREFANPCSEITLPGSGGVCALKGPDDETSERTVTGRTSWAPPVHTEVIVRNVGETIPPSVLAEAIDRGERAVRRNARAWPWGKTLEHTIESAGLRTVITWRFV